MPARAREFSLVTEDEQAEMDEESEQQILASFASTRAKEKTEVAAVEILRYQNIPQRDPGGKLIRDPEGRITKGPLILYFRRLEAGSLLTLRQDYTVKTPVKRAGRIQYDEKFDDEGFSLHIAYIAMLPWCRTMYFDNQKLWGEEPVGTGEEFMRQRLNLGELGYCLSAVQELEGLGEERADSLGKSSKTAGI